MSVQDAKDGGISQIQVGATMDCSVQEAGETPHCVYGSRSKTITETKYGAFRR